MEKKLSGFSLIELIMVISIASILLLIGIPSYQDNLKRQRVNGIGDNLHFLMRLARAEAAKKNNPMYLETQVNDSDDTLWCVALSDIESCDCMVAQSCQINGIGKQFNSQQYREVAMTSNDVTFTIHPTQGRGTNDTVSFAIDNYDVRLIRSQYGRNRICTTSSANLRHPAC